MILLLTLQLLPYSYTHFFCPFLFINLFYLTFNSARIVVFVNSFLHIFAIWKVIAIIKL